MKADDSLALLMSGRMPERYLRNLGTIGIPGQLKLLKAKVAVIGAGGLGGYVIELLARQGVGHLVIVDGDRFAIHNLNRQLLATEQAIGRNKAVVAASRVAEINPDVQVTVISQVMRKENAAQCLSGVNVAVDALDSIQSRRLLAGTACEMRIPWVYAAIGGFTGQISTILPEDTGLRRFLEHPAGVNSGAERQLGTPAVTPALAAALQAQETVKLITGIGQTLSRRMLYFDLESNLFEFIELQNDEKEK